VLVINVNSTNGQNSSECKDGSLQTSAALQEMRLNPFCIAYITHLKIPVLEPTFGSKLARLGRYPAWAGILGVRFGHLSMI